MIAHNGNYYADLPSFIPPSTEVHQLPVIKLSDRNFYGWKLVYTKQVKTGKADKNGKPITKTVVDNSKPVTYDQETTAMIKQNSSNSAIVRLMTAVAQQKFFNVSILNQLAQLKVGAKK